METRILLILLTVVVVSGCTSSGPADTSLNPETLSQEEVTTYTIDTGAASSQEVRDILETRFSNAGISHSIDQVEGNSSDSGLLELKVESAGNSSAQRDRIKELLEPGKFEAVLRFSTAGRDEIRYGNGSDMETFSIGRNQDEYVFGGDTYREGEEFSFKGRSAYFEDGELKVVAYNGDDIVSAGDQRTVSGRAGVRASTRITLSQDASHHLHRLLQNYKKGERTGYLEKVDGESAMMHLTMDDKTFQSLAISGSFKERRIRDTRLVLNGETQEEANEKMSQIRSKIVSGKLPEGIKIEQVE